MGSPIAQYQFEKGGYEMNLKKMSGVFLASAMVLAACGGDDTTTTGENNSTDVASNGGETKVLKIGVSAADSAVQGLFTMEKVIEEKTGGTIDVQVYANGALGGDVQVLEGVRTGTIEGGAMSPSILATLEPTFNVFDVPFLFNTAQDGYDLMDGEIGKELLASLEQHGLIGLGYTDATFRNLTNNKLPVRTPADLKGLNVRTLENQLQIALWKELGANPQAIAFTELYSALESNVIDGQENPYPVIESGKLYEVQKYVTETNHLMMPRVLFVGDKFWEKLSDEEKKIVQETAAETMIEMRNNAEGLIAASKATIESGGAEIITITDEERQQWKDIAQKVYPQFEEVIGADVFNRVVEAVSK